MEHEVLHTKTVKSTVHDAISLRGVVTGLGLATAALVAAAPYLGAGFPRTNDALTHLYRAVALDRVFSPGHMWPRWLPDLVMGFGYPVTSFFPALSHILVELLHLVGISFTVAYRGVVGVHFVLSAWFTYLLATDESGWAGGWVAALAYVYSPYVLYDAHVRGSLPEGLALAFLPLLLLAMKQSVMAGLVWIPLVSIAFSATFLSHHGIAFQSVIVIGMWLVWLRSGRRWLSLWRPVAGLFLGVLLTAFFWLPTLAEMQYIQGQSAIAAAVSYRDNFLDLSEMVQTPRLPADPTLLNPPVVRSLPLVALGLSLCLLCIRWRRLGQEVRHSAAFWLVMVVICTLLIMPVAAPIWDVLPLLKLTIFPWRLLGPASLAAALCLGAAFSEVTRALRTLALVVCVMLLLLLGGVFWLYPPREEVPESPDVADLVAFEQPPFLIGTTTYGEFLPRWVTELPAGTELQTQLATGVNPDRLLVPDGMEVNWIGGSALHSVYVIIADAPFAASYQQFYFPGWRVWLDGVPLAIRPSDPAGLIEFDVPAGEHQLEIRFASTWSRILGISLSCFGVAILLLMIVQSLRKWKTWSGSGEMRHRALPIGWVVLLVSVVLGTKLFLDRVETPLRRGTRGPDGTELAQYSAMSDFAGELLLLGYDLPRNSLSASDDIAVTLYWEALHPIGVVYDRVVQVVDDSEFVWSAGELSRPPDWRWAPGTDRWSVDEYVMDPFVVHLLDGTPPGEYAIRVSLVRHDTHQTVTEQKLVRVTVTEPATGDRIIEGNLVELDPVERENDALRLLATGTDRRQAAPGDPIRVTILWQVKGYGTTGLSNEVIVELVSADDHIVWSTMSPIASQYVAADWQADARLRTEAVFRLPAHLSDGEYVWRARLGPDSVWVIGMIDIHNPERLWEPPMLDIEVNASFGGIAVLLGANIEQAIWTTEPPATHRVTLVWQSAAESEMSYRVFLHLRDAQGAVVSQSDGEPAGWTRPTTGWLPGEVILDERILQLPADLSPGSYTLYCGLYDADSGRRLVTVDGANEVVLGSAVIGSD